LARHIKKTIHNLLESENRTLKFVLIRKESIFKENTCLGEKLTYFDIFLLTSSKIY